MKEPLTLACECGATVKVSDLDGVTLLAVERIWRDIHANHEAVTCAQANEIRSAERARRKKLREWYEGG